MNLVLRYRIYGLSSKVKCVLKYIFVKCKFIWEVSVTTQCFVFVSDRGSLHEISWFDVSSPVCFWWQVLKWKFEITHLRSNFTLSSISSVGVLETEAILYDCSFTGKMLFSLFIFIFCHYLYNFLWLTKHFAGVLYGGLAQLFFTFHALFYGVFEENCNFSAGILPIPLHFRSHPFYHFLSEKELNKY